MSKQNLMAVPAISRRKALLIGNDHYEHFVALNSCTRDCVGLQNCLEKNEDSDRINFEVRSLFDAKKVEMENAILELLSRDAEVALLHFSGHGGASETDGFLCATDSTEQDQGVSMNWLITKVNETDPGSLPEIVITLDCCYSGKFGSLESDGGLSKLRKGVTILAASSGKETVVEFGGFGAFSKIMIDGLKGNAADLQGNVTAAGLYAIADTLLGPWNQRPVFKINVRQLTVLRECKPNVPLKTIKQITQSPFFKEYYDKLVLSSDMLTLTHPNDLAGNGMNLSQVISLFAFEKSGFLDCPDGKTLLEAIKSNQSCGLSDYGKHAWNLVKQNRL